MNIGERLHYLRNKCWLTQNGLAEKAGVSQTHLRRVELGQADITVGHLQLLCDAMDITLQDFFAAGDSDDRLYTSISKLTPKQKKLLMDFIDSL